MRRRSAAPQGGVQVPSDRPFIAVEKVRFDGEPVAAVAAESLAIADEALQLIEVDYDMLPPVYHGVEALQPGAPLIDEQWGTNLVGDYRLAWGNVEEGFKQADHIFEESFSFPTLFHHPMENIGTCLVHSMGDEITLWAPIQHPYGAAEEAATLFGLEPEKIRICIPYIGGGFGAKEMKPNILCALWLARKAGRPVKMMPSMEESIRNDARHAVEWKAKVGV